MDIPGTVGGSTAYVGFTAASGGSTAIQDILNWNYMVTTSAYDNRIAGNVVAGNSGPGVAVVGTASVGDDIVANSIYGNTGQAIDLGDDGVTPNAASPRQGPNDLQNDPAIVALGGGAYEGRLAGSEPDTTYRIDVFASAGYNNDGSGEAQDFLGSLAVTTDESGQASFSVPYMAPAALPVITATATDPAGNTSEVSAQRTGSFQLSSLIPRLAAGQQTLVLSNASGPTVALEDPEAGPIDGSWTLALSVSAGTLTLATTAGLVGSGDGTGSLSYTGPLSALNAALDGMIYTAPPSGLDSPATVSLEAHRPAQRRPRPSSSSRTGNSS